MIPSFTSGGTDYLQSVTNAIERKTKVVGGRAKFGTELRPYLAAYDFPPRLEATRFSPQGQIQFDVAGAAGRNYIVQTSTDLSKWSSVLTNFGPFTVQDARTTNGALYYRVISPK